MQNTSAIETLREFLKSGNNRITPERFEVLNAALEFSGHFSADELYILMKNNNSAVSRATVYNTIELLLQSGLICVRNFGENTKRYECSGAGKNHDHFVCTNCGKIVEFTDKRISNIAEEISASAGFTFSSYSFNIFVKCANSEACNPVNK